MKELALDTPAPNTDITSQVATVVAAYLSHNTVPAADIGSVINTVHASLSSLGTAIVVPAEAPKPAVSVRKSITPEYLICLEDGKKLKMLKRHLASTYNLTPDQYRQRWGLSADYPMVAPRYSEQRSALAKQLGLGTAAARRAPAPATRARRNRRAAASA
jgi:predicted transcriptional regulator